MIIKRKRNGRTSLLTRSTPAEAKMLLMFLALVLGLQLSADTASAEQKNVSYLIAAPKAFRPNSVYTLTATCYNTSDDVDLRLLLQSSGNYTLVEKKEVLSNGVTKTVSLQIPSSVADAEYWLVAEGSGGLTFFKRHRVDLKHKTLSLFVQTDKAMYKPGQKVLFRAIAVHPDLKPYKDVMDIEIFDLAGNKIMQWLKQKSDSGVVTLSLALADQTPLGDWKIVVTAGENKFTKTFQVAEYVLPKFEVVVTLPSFYLVNLNRREIQANLPVTVTAKYTFGQMVKGRAEIVVRVQGYRYESPETEYATKTMNVELVNGKADVSLQILELVPLLPVYHYRGSVDPWTLLSSRTLQVDASVQEAVTGIVLTGNGTVGCKAQKHNLRFLDITPSNYKGGLRFTAFLHLSQTDGGTPDPVDIKLPDGQYRSVNVKVTYYTPHQTDPHHPWIWSQAETHENISVMLTASGYMTFSLPISYNLTSIILQAYFNETSTNSTLSAYKSLSPFESRDNQGIQIYFESPDGVLKASKEVKFGVRTTQATDSIHYEILSKGNIILSEKVVGESTTQHSFTIFVTKALCTKLAPVARVVVWFVTASGEIITDSTDISVADGFTNQVSLSFDKESTTPAHNVTLTLNAYSGSYIGILAVDQSVLLLKGGNDITQDMVIKDLKSYDSTPQDHYYFEDDFVEVRRKRSVWWPLYIDGRDSSTVLSNAGLIILTDAYIHHYRRYYAYDGPVLRKGGIGVNGGVDFAFERGDDDIQLERASFGSHSDSSDSSKPRTNFPETWLWTDVTAGEDGQAKIQTSVPDTITSWIASAFAISDVAGLGVATNTAKLTVFKQFFVSPNLPYSIIRGEEFALRVTIFNYLSTVLDVNVTIEESAFFSLNDSSASKPAKVNSDDAVSVYFWIVAKSLGQIPINIMAKSPVAGDSVKVMLLVKPEGVPQQYSTSALVQLSPSAPTYNNTLKVSLPSADRLVPGSEHITVTVIGDIMGPSVNGLDSLLQMPYGCGEQNMLTFAPDVYIVKYLTISNQLGADIRSKALGFMLAGYQRELTFQRNDGSFSAFGNSDAAGSCWLSSFVIKCFHQAKDYISVDDGKIAQTMNWILGNQAEQGSFAEPPFGRVLHTDMQGGSSKGLPLTAYVLISLLENENNSRVDKRFHQSIMLARNYLEEQVTSASSDPYALSIMAYALAKAKSSKVLSVLELLEALAKVEADTKHWEKPSGGDDKSEKMMWQPPYSQAKSVNIEMTSYVLLTYCELNDLSMSLPIVKWLIMQRNANGGFSSTQDTVMALEALAAFASMIIGPSGIRDLQVSISTASAKYSFPPITDETSLLLQSYQIPSDSSEVFVSATGKGSALVQLSVYYNVKKTDDESEIKMNITTEHEDKTITVKSCSSWKNEEESGMVVMEFNQLTGFKASNLDQLKVQMENIKRIESTDEKIIVYLDELTSDETCIVIKSEKILPVSKVQDASIKIYPYYNPSNARTMMYAASPALAQEDHCIHCPHCCTNENKKGEEKATGVDVGASYHLLANFWVVTVGASLVICLLL